MGYDSKAIDGKFGPNTEKAVIQFQEKNGLVKKDGKVGKDTWAKLCSLYNEKSSATLDDLIDGSDKASGDVVVAKMKFVKLQTFP